MALAPLLSQSLHVCNPHVAYTAVSAATSTTTLEQEHEGVLLQDGKWRGCMQCVEAVPEQDGAHNEASAHIGSPA
eukprot:12114-Heterococcus_DN1.PRE.2